VAAAVSLFTLFSMLKIWNDVFWKSYPGDISAMPRANAGLLGPSAALVAVSIAIAVWAAPVLSYSQLSAEQVRNIGSLVQDVCGPAGCDAVDTTVSER
jgi:multicomponent Na+:H+ antiporter subunit D